MLPYIALTLSGVSVCALTIQYVIRLGVMDIPVQRSAHTVPTPKGGGIGILSGLCFGLALYLVMHPPSFDIAFRLGILLTAVAILALFSWRDDIHHFPAVAKLGVQVIACVLVAFSGVWGMQPGWAGGAAFAVAVPYVIFVTNALNFMDGINGLAGGAIALSSFIFAPILLVVGLTAEGALFYLLALGALTFLYFNFPRARIFMGDVGSQPSGLILGWAGIIFARDTSWSFLPTFMLAGILFDVAFTLVRRTWHGDNLMTAHRGHLYQIAVRAGVSPTHVTYLHWFFIIWGACVGLLINHLPVALVAVILPQLFWAVRVCHLARKHEVTP